MREKTSLGKNKKEVEEMEQTRFKSIQQSNGGTVGHDVGNTLTDRNEGHLLEGPNVACSRKNTTTSRVVDRSGG